MPDVVIAKQDTLDLNTPALSSTSDMPVVETKPDASPQEVKPETPPEPKEPAAEPKPEESAPPEQPDDPSAEPEPKKAKGVQKRIDELTRQREDERRRAEAAEARLDRALSALEKGTVRDTKQAIESEDQEPQKPTKDPNDPEAYDAALEQYVSDRASWIARREVKASLAEQEKQRSDREIADQTKRVQESYLARVEKVKEKYSDYKEVAESPDVQVSIVMASAIAHAEEGPEIAYYLGKNPSEAERISKLVPQLQLVELGKISVKINSPAVPTKPISAAPAPGKPSKPSSETIPTPEEEPMEAYAKRRRQEMNERNRPGVRH